MKKVIAAVLFFMMALSVSAQDQGTGLEEQPKKLTEAMQKAQPNGIVVSAGALPGDGQTVSALPTRVDLSRFLPPVRSQGNIGSCAAWCSIYYSKSMQENMARGWGADDDNEIFNPMFTYNQVTGGRNEGTWMTEHMDIVVNQGCATLATFSELYDTYARPGAAAIQEAARYKAEEYRGIRYDATVEDIKTILASGHPVAVGFYIDDGFYYFDGGVYDYYSGEQMYGHGVTIVGYDDNRRVLKIVNSWGENWGDNGFMDMSYDVFSDMYMGGAVLYGQGGGNNGEDGSGSDTSPEVIIEPPLGVAATQGTYSDNIKITWNGMDNAARYVVYRSNNGDASLEELARVSDPEYIDGPLPEGVNYLYSVTTLASNGRESEFSSVTEGWTSTTERYDIPGIPGNFDYFYTGSVALFFWDEVDNADGYTLYRWDETNEVWSEYGTTTDGFFLDKWINDYSNTTTAYYIVSAHNRNGESYATNYTSVTLNSAAVNAPPSAVSNIRSGDDRHIQKRRADEYKGSFYDTDYFDYETTMAKFREFYEAEQKAFAEWKENEMSEFEKWKAENEGR